ncbi:MULTISPECIES: ABC transporter permease [unclassified Ensifer]|uniref:ABC transporter permease n=1 Tax=unclassified Ensifer TaxID=2633371 RepID=UPI00088B2759|nr:MULTISPECIES: ABC transporter permease [unclassified Ensifer]MBD9594841.1 ABC transporter permease [Ensifer sp. ENS05]SDN81667.1 peptide/nickel transport system permease protein [Ensifer sp. YR511]
MADVNTSSPQEAPIYRSSPLRRALSEPLTLIGVIVVVMHLLLGALSPLIAPYDASALVGAPLMPPSSEFLMGTDQIGRDYFSRIIEGGRIALMVSFCGVAIALVIGSILGVLAGYLGGRFDEAIMRFVDAMMAIPEIIMIAILTLALGKDVVALIPIVAVVYTWGVVRVIRSKTISLSTLDFVRAAELRGETRWSIMLREIFPNLIGLLGVELAVRVSSAVLRISALSFLGLGISQPTPDWGLMVQEAMGVVFTDPWFLLLPAAMLSSLIIAVNFAVDGFASAFGITSTEL